MADSSSNITQISNSQLAKEALANSNFDAASPALGFGRNPVGSSLLTWAFYGGRVFDGGTMQTVANGTATLTASTTNYVELDPVTRAVSVATGSFTAGRVPLYTVVTDASTATSWTDFRGVPYSRQPRLSMSVAGGGNITLNQAQAAADVIEFTGTLTANIAVICPNNMPLKVLRNLTTGAFTLTIRTSGGTGPAPAQNRSILAYANGTDVIRVTPDQATP